jgi:DNA gyrase/topoisomerase IV subunit A
MSSAAVLNNLVLTQNKKLKLELKEREKTIKELRNKLKEKNVDCKYLINNLNELEKHNKKQKRVFLVLKDINDDLNYTIKHFVNLNDIFITNFKQNGLKTLKIEFDENDAKNYMDNVENLTYIYSTFEDIIIDNLDEVDDGYDGNYKRRKSKRSKRKSKRSKRKSRRI